MNALLILNPHAGTIAGAPNGLAPAEIVETLRAAGIRVTQPEPKPAGLDSTLTAAVALRPEVVIVGGGDGTISTAAGVLADTGIPLGVLPLGTLNHFAADLGLPADWRKTVAALAQGSVRQVDVAEANGRVFVNNCSVGSYAEAVRRRDRLRHEQGHGKWRAMVLATLAVWRNFRRMRLRIDTPEGSLTLRTLFVLVANNRYSGGVLDSSLRPRLDEGRLWFYTTRAHRSGALLRLVWQSLTRRVDAADELEVHSATEMTITSERGPMPVAADGELIAPASTLHLRIRPGALRVLAPATGPQ